ncbi:hypothetical protein AMECASPLE_033852 [Ameca splendens]|uniref:Uncharacterized protein n=1 Tax=Ameca splendens TaxID=208324 RepID=A0ABV1ADC2_9TELE
MFRSIQRHQAVQELRETLVRIWEEISQYIICHQSTSVARLSDEAYHRGVQALYKQARDKLTKEIKLAKRSCSEKIKTSLSANDYFSVEESADYYQLQYRSPTPHAVTPPG